MEKRDVEGEPRRGVPAVTEEVISCSMPQFPYLQSGIIDVLFSVVHRKIRCISAQEMLGTGLSVWQVLSKWEQRHTPWAGWSGPALCAPFQ